MSETNKNIMHLLNALCADQIQLFSGSGQKIVAELYQRAQNSNFTLSPETQKALDTYQILNPDQKETQTLLLSAIKEENNQLILIQTSPKKRGK